jgi:PPP family 3-phenylpropionic acid transporter
MRDRLAEAKVRAFFLSATLMVFAHSGLYALFSLYLETYGYSKSLIGLIWAIGVLAEIALFRWQQPLFARFAVGQLLVFSVVVAVFRFAGVAWSEGALGWIVMTQVTHAITFGVHHSACMQVLHRWFDDRQQPAAQALFTTLSYGVGGTLGGLAAGWIWTALGPAAVFWLASATASLSAAVLIRALKD